MSGMTTLVVGVRKQLDAAGAGIDREATMTRWAQALESHLSWLVKSGVLVTLHDDDTAAAVTPGDLPDVVIVDRLEATLTAELGRWDGWSLTVTDTRPKKAKLPAAAPVVGGTAAAPTSAAVESGDETTGG